MQTHVAILADLQGPKLRIGEVENNGIALRAGETLEFTNNPCLGTSGKVYMSYPLFSQDVSIADGKLKLQVIKTNKKDTAWAKVLNGGILSSRKGVNYPKPEYRYPV